MRIVLDLQGMQTGGSRLRGIGRYSFSFAKALCSHASHHDIWIVLNGAFPNSIQPIIQQFENLVPKDRIRIFDIPSFFTPTCLTHEWRNRVAEYLRESFLSELNPDIVHVSSLFEGWTDHAIASIGLVENQLPVSVTLYDFIPWLKKKFIFPCQAWRHGTQVNSHH